jgi:hypothetical protein
MGQPGDVVVPDRGAHYDLCRRRLRGGRTGADGQCDGDTPAPSRPTGARSHGPSGVNAGPPIFNRSRRTTNQRQGRWPDQPNVKSLRGKRVRPAAAGPNAACGAANVAPESSNVVRACGKGRMQPPPRLPRHRARNPQRPHQARELSCGRRAAALVLALLPRRRLCLSDHDPHVASGMPPGPGHDLPDGTQRSAARHPSRVQPAGRRYLERAGGLREQPDLPRRSGALLRRARRKQAQALAARRGNPRRRR